MNGLRLGLGVASIVVMIIGLVMIQHQLAPNPRNPNDSKHGWMSPICNSWVGASMFVVGWMFATSNLSNDPVDDWPKWPFIKTH